MKNFILFLAMLSFPLYLSAQDKICRKDGTLQNVKVLKVNKKNIQFVRSGTSAPEYTWPTKDIAFIFYENGETDVFNMTEISASVLNGLKKTVKESSSSTQSELPDKWHGAVKPRPDMPLRKPVIEEHRYVIGELYRNGPVKGIVVLVNDLGRHGLIVSLEEANLPWSTLEGKMRREIGASSLSDGEENMKAVEKYIGEHGLAWKDFPAFEWCRNLGDGWYLPSLNEMYAFGTIYNGGSRNLTDRYARANMSAAFLNAEGAPLHRFNLYSSSSEYGRKDYHYSTIAGKEPYTGVCSKSTRLYVRAFRKF